MALKKPLVFDSGVPAELNSADTLNIDAALVVNDSGADVDVRIETNAYDQFFIVDGGESLLRIGTSVAGTIAQIGASVIQFNGEKVDRNFSVFGTAVGALISTIPSSDNQGGDSGVGRAADWTD